MKNGILIFSILLTLFSCQSNQIDPESCEAIDRNTDRYENATSDPFDLVTAKIEGDCLVLTVRYGGGCESVDFDLVAFNGSRFSLPPQIPMRLILEDNDPCEALITEDIAFDLSALHDQGADVLMLDLEGLGEMLNYQY